MDHCVVSTSLCNTALVLISRMDHLKEDEHGLLGFPTSCMCETCRLYKLNRHLASKGLAAPEPKPNPDLHPSSEQGKVAELRQELNNSGKKDKNHAAKKNALKKIVANMTMSNNDMVALFPDIIACMQIPVLEIKKM